MTKKLAIITDGATLNKYVGQTLRQYATVHERLHIAAVSAITFAAKTGDVRPLNRLHDGLKSNDQSALKLFIRRAHAIVGLEGDNPDGLASEIVQGAIEAGKVFDFKQKNYVVVNGHNTTQAKAMLSLCEARFINPDGETDQMVFERNNFTEVKTLGDADVLKALAKFAETNMTSTDTRNIEVSAKVRKMLTEIKDRAEQMASQYEVGKPSKSNPPANDAKPKAAKPKATAKNTKGEAVAA